MNSIPTVQTRFHLWAEDKRQDMATTLAALSSAFLTSSVPLLDLLIADNAICPTFRNLGSVWAGVLLGLGWQPRTETELTPDVKDIRCLSLRDDIPTFELLRTATLSCATALNKCGQDVRFRVATGPVPSVTLVLSGRADEFEDSKYTQGTMHIAQRHRAVSYDPARSSPPRQLFGVSVVGVPSLVVNVLAAYYHATGRGDLELKRVAGEIDRRKLHADYTDESRLAELIMATSPS